MVYKSFEKSDIGFNIDGICREIYYKRNLTKARQETSFNKGGGRP